MCPSCNFTPTVVAATPNLKSLDLAAKHITAGDVGDLKICQVT